MTHGMSFAKTAKLMPRFRWLASTVLRETIMRMGFLKILILTGFVITTTTLGNGKSEELSAMEYTLHKGLVYSRVVEELRLDLFLPLNVSKPVPCVIVIQGGGFKSQDGQRFRPFAEHLARNGFAAALIEYRGLPDHTYRETIADIKAAVRFVRKNSAEFGIASEKIGAIGRSAGATLAALLAVSGGVEEFEGEGGHAGVSSRIQAAVGIAGVYDFVARFTEEEQISIQSKLDTKIMSNGAWIGTPFSPTHKDWLTASAINHVDAMDPPMLLMHSKNDQTVPWIQSRSMHKTMIEAGINSEIEISEEGGHGGPATAMKSMVNFFRKILAEQSAAPDADEPHR